MARTAVRATVGGAEHAVTSTAPAGAKNGDLWTDGGGVLHVSIDGVWTRYPTQALGVTERWNISGFLLTAPQVRAVTVVAWTGQAEAADVKLPPMDTTEAGKRLTIKLPGTYAPGTKLNGVRIAGLSRAVVEWDGDQWLGPSPANAASVLALDIDVTRGPAQTGTLPGNWSAPTGATNTITQLSGGRPGFRLAAGLQHELRAGLYGYSIGTGAFLHVRWRDLTNGVNLPGMVGGINFAGEDMVRQALALVTPASDIDVALVTHAGAGTLTLRAGHDEAGCVLIATTGRL